MLWFIGRVVSVESQAEYMNESYMLTGTLPGIFPRNANISLSFCLNLPKKKQKKQKT